MKDGTCTHCEGTEIYEIEEARIPNYESSNGVDALTLTAHYGPSGESGMFGAKSARSASSRSNAGSRFFASRPVAQDRSSS